MTGMVSLETVGAAIALLLSGQVAAAGAAGGGALALAALVADASPKLTASDQRVMALMFEGDLNFAFPANRKIAVRADAVTCRASNVDISFHACTLTFGTETARLEGRKAHELFATLGEAGVVSEGAAGSSIESLAHLACTIDPNAVKQRAGGGADCKFDAGSP